MNDNVPAGADFDSKAPWNEKEEKIEGYACTVSVTFSFSTEIYASPDDTEEQIAEKVPEWLDLPEEMNGELINIDNITIIKE